MRLKPITFDAARSRRHYDENGFLHVDSSHITKEQVVKYYGREIPGWQELHLDPDRLYNVYRPAAEIEQAVRTFNGLPLLLTHHIESASEPQKDYRVGSISAPRWNAPYLDAELHITDGAAIDAVENGDFKEISAAYLYEPVLEHGTFNHTNYEIVMRNIRGNHVALVREGRAGPDVVVADKKPEPRPLRSFAAWLRKNPLALKDTPTVGWVRTKTALDSAVASDDAWITVQSNGGGRHVLLGDDGTIKAGIGGKFNGQRIDLIPRKPKAPPSGVISTVPTKRYNIPKMQGGTAMSKVNSETSAATGARGYNKIGETPDEQRALAKAKVNTLIKERLGDMKFDVDNIGGALAVMEAANKDASDAVGEAMRAQYAAERKAQEAYQKWKYPDENGDWEFYNDKTGKLEKVHFSPEQREEFRKEYEREVATAKRQEKIKQQYGEEHTITDRAVKRLQETKIELERRAKAERWKSSPVNKAAQAVKEKNYPIPAGQVRFKTPLRVEGETEKAYRVSSTINEEESMYSAWVPKSRVTMRDGHVIGGEAWLRNAKAKEGLTIDNKPLEQKK